MFSLFKAIFLKVTVSFGVKHAPTILIALLTSVLSAGTLLGSLGQAVVAANIRKMVPSNIEVSYKNGKIEEILRLLQQSCGVECFASQIYYKEVDYGVVAYFNFVVGHFAALKKTANLKGFSDSNSIYYQLHTFPNMHAVGLDLISDNTSCVSVSKDQLIERKLSEILSLLDSLHVDIQNLTACLRKNSDTIVVLTWHQKTDCGRCLDNVYDAGKSIERILQAKFI